MRYAFAPCLALLLACLWTATLKGDQRPTTAVGAAKVDITPDEPIRLTGYGNRQIEATEVAQKLYARALAIGTDDEGPTVVACVDLLGITAELRDQILRRVQATHPLEDRQFVLGSTHTHTGPVVTGLAHGLLVHTMRDDHQQRIDRYTKRLVDKVAEAITTALDNRQEARLYHGRGEVGFAMNRRVLRDGTWAGFGVAEDGPVDHRLPVVVAKDTDDKPLAVWVNYACHCTTLGGQFNKIAGDWAGYASEEIEKTYPGVTALVSIGCGADANPEPRDGPEALEWSAKHGKAVATEVQRLLAQPLKPLSPKITGKFEMIELPFQRPRTRDEWQDLAKQGNQTGAYGEYYLQRLEEGPKIPTSLPYRVSTLLFGDDLAMVFLPGEVVVDYSIRLHAEMDDEKLWVSAYSNDVPCYIPSRRILVERGYEAEFSMIFYWQPNSLDPAVENLIVDTVQKLLPPKFYSEAKQQEFPPPASPEDALQSIRVPEGLKVELVASEPLIMDPVAFDWHADGSLWVVEMGDYPSGLDGKGLPGGQVKVLRDTNGDGRYDSATLFLRDIPFPTGIKVWRDGVLITAAPDILYAEDQTGDDVADVTKVLYTGFGKGNQQHRVNGLRWGLDNWLYVGNGDSDGNIRSTTTGQTVGVRKRDLRIRPDTGELLAFSGNTQFGIAQDDWGHWFGGNNSNPVWHYVLDQRYLDRNPHVVFPDTKRMVSDQPGAAIVFPISRTLHRYNDFDRANRFTSACSPIIYRDHLLGEQYAGNSFVCEPVHNLIQREVVSPQGVTFTSTRAPTERNQEFFASTDNWSRPAMIRTGPDGGLWVADFYRFVIEHPQWIPGHEQRKLDIRGGHDLGRIYRIVPEEGARDIPVLEGMSPRHLVDQLRSANGTLRDMAHQLLLWRDDSESIPLLREMALTDDSPLARIHALSILDGLEQVDEPLLLTMLEEDDPRVTRHAVRVAERWVNRSEQIGPRLSQLSTTQDPHLRLQVAHALGEWKNSAAGPPLGNMLITSASDTYLRAAITSSLNDHNLETALETVLSDEKAHADLAVITPLLQTAIGQGENVLVERLVLAHVPDESRFSAEQLTRILQLFSATDPQRTRFQAILAESERLQKAIQRLERAAVLVATDTEAKLESRIAALDLLRRTGGSDVSDWNPLVQLISPQQPGQLQLAILNLLAERHDESLPGLLPRFSTFTPALKSTLIEHLTRRQARTEWLLSAVEAGQIAAAELSPAVRQQLLNHSDDALRESAHKLLGKASSREDVLKRFQSALHESGDAESGTALFKKHCAACHQVGEIGHAVGPDLAAISNRAPELLLVDILDPNAAVEEKYLQYTAATVDGLLHSGRLLSETENAIVLEGAEKKRFEILRPDLEELRSTGVSLMPEGLEKDLDSQNLADLLAFIGQIGPDPKSFPGLMPTVIKQQSETIELPASATFLFGDSIRFESTYGSLDQWAGPTDKALWRMEVTEPGQYQVHLEYACDPLHSGNRFQVTLAEQTLAQTSRATPSWDEFRSHALGTVALEAGPARLTIQSVGNIHREALMRLRMVRLVQVPATDGG